MRRLFIGSQYGFVYDRRIHLRRANYRFEFTDPLKQGIGPPAYRIGAEVFVARRDRMEPQTG